MRVAIGRAHASLTGKEPIASLCQTLSITKAALVESSIRIAKLSGELYIGREILELRVISRASTIVFHCLVINEGITEHASCGVTLIIDKLHITSLSCRAVLLSQARS